MPPHAEFDNMSEDPGPIRVRTKAVSPPAIQLLGPLRVSIAGQEVPITSRRQRGLVALLAMSANEVVPSERLIDQLWDGNPPGGALVTLRSYISHIRRALLTTPQCGVMVSTVGSGYRLDVDEVNIDVVRFRRLIASGHRLMRDGAPRDAIAEFDDALSLWRGQPFADVADHEVSAPQLAEVHELRASAVEARLHALVDAGRHLEAIPGLESLVADSPLRDRPYELLMLALHRSGRAADALAVHARYRSLLRDQLGIDPSPRLDQLVTAILNRDVALDLVADGAAPRIGATGRPDSEQALADLVAELIRAVQTLSEQAAVAVNALNARREGLSPEPMLSTVA